MQSRFDLNGSSETVTSYMAVEMATSIWAVLRVRVLGVVKRAKPFVSSGHPMEWRLPMNYCCQHMPIIPQVNLLQDPNLKTSHWEVCNYLGTSLYSFDNRHWPYISDLLGTRTNARSLMCYVLCPVNLIICRAMPSSGFGQHAVNSNSLQVTRSYLFISRNFSSCTWRPTKKPNPQTCLLLNPCPTSDITQQLATMQLLLIKFMPKLLPPSIPGCGCHIQLTSNSIYHCG